VDVVFFERDAPYYAEHRDLAQLPAGRLVLYPDWTGVRSEAARALHGADAAMITSYCPDAAAAALLLQDRHSGVSAFYDMDTPVTLARLAAGETVDYVPPGGLAGFDLVLSYTGGSTLQALRERLGARRTAPLYGHVDAASYAPATAGDRYAADLSYIGTYAADRQPGVEQLFIAPARRRPELPVRFWPGRATPRDFPGPPTPGSSAHLPPAEQPAFYAGSRLTLETSPGATWPPRVGALRSDVRATACCCPVLQRHLARPGRLLSCRAGGVLTGASTGWDA
jgi:spore maturation protein CgeB